MSGSSRKNEEKLVDIEMERQSSVKEFCHKRDLGEECFLEGDIDSRSY